MLSCLSIVVKHEVRLCVAASRAIGSCHNCLLKREYADHWEDLNRMYRRTVCLASRLALFLVTAAFFQGIAQAQQAGRLDSYGPYNGVFLAGGNSLEKSLPEDDPLFAASTPWTLYCWFQSSEELSNPTLVAGAGNPADEDSRFFGIQNRKLIFWLGKGNSVSASTPLTASSWHFAVATFDGIHLHLYSDGQEVAAGDPAMARVHPMLQLAPEDMPWTDGRHFGGLIASLTLLRSVLTSAQVQALYSQSPNASLISFEAASKPWPVQTRAQGGYRAPQDPSQMPNSAAPPSTAVAQPAPPSHTTLISVAANKWRLDGGWKLIPAPKVDADGAAISRLDFKTTGWWAATVPGTVLTTMIDRGVYPDSDYGLNNLARVIE
jgi:Concanavalin A-like lectin/glucanases superfamily